MFPSASLAQNYESVTVATDDGRVQNGLVMRETSQELVLAIGPNKEVRIMRDQIEEMRPSTTSIMPAGLDKQLSLQDLSDLLQFLETLK